MERSFSDIASEILERNPDAGFQRLGEHDLQILSTWTPGGVPSLTGCRVSGEEIPVETVNHGPGIQLDVELEVEPGSEGIVDSLRHITIGPIEPSGEASMLAALGLGWREQRIDDEAIESRESQRAFTFSGRVPASFLVGTTARFQIQLTSLAGNTGIYFAAVNVNKAVLAKLRKGGGDGDDPRDLPPPSIHGEELEMDDDNALIYLVSDFHLGSNMDGNRNSNDMDWQTLEKFMKFLRAAEADAVKRKVPYYDVVMNGDFLDLWQAKRSTRDTYVNRLEDIIASNTSFFAQLGRFLRSSGKCRFYYVIGNHDDPLLTHTDPDDPVFGPRGGYSRLRGRIRDILGSSYENMILGGKGRVWYWKRTGQVIPFSMQEAYSNRPLRVYAAHGHQFDEVNSRDSDHEPSDGQSVAEKINEMQEADPSFRHIEYVPLQETAKYFRCLIRDADTPERITDKIDELKEEIISASAGWLGQIADVALSDEAVAEKIIDATEPDSIRDTTRSDAEEYYDDLERRPGEKIFVTGHTHLEDLNPSGGEHDEAYANTGSWFRRVTFERTGGDCVLRVQESLLPYVRISKVKGKNKALVEVNYFSGANPFGWVVVDLDN